MSQKSLMRPKNLVRRTIIFMLSIYYYTMRNLHVWRIQINKFDWKYMFDRIPHVQLDQIIIWISYIQKKTSGQSKLFVYILKYIHTQK